MSSDFSPAELVALGVPEALAPRAAAHLGDDAAALLRGDPWELLRLPGVTPAQADRFALAVLPRADPQDPRRGRALVAHLLAEAARRGDTALPGERVVTALREMRVTDPVAAINAALDEARVMLFLEEPADVPEDVEDFPDPEEWLALARYGLAEETVAEGVQRLAATAPPLDVPDDGKPPEGEAAAQALFHGVSVVTGPVGVLLTELAATGLAVAVTAVTATAAGEHPGAVSLHRLLEAREGHGGLGYARGEQWPLEADVVVVTGAEALDVELAAALFEACPDGVHLVLCGDPDGLASLRPGRVLADLVASEAVPVTSVPPLDGPLSELAEGVRGGSLPVVSAPGREVVVVPVADGREAAHRAGQLLTDSIPRALGIATGDVQVLTPGLAGTAAFNAALKAVVNPGPGAFGGFDVGDRVLVAVPFGDAAAGETGTVTEADEQGLTVAFPDAEVRVPLARAARLRHGWAIPVQQAAGTRWPAVVAVFPSAADLSGALLLTAVTRARAHLSIVTAAGPALTRAAADLTPPARRTRLVGLLA
ncbi:ATP-dependent RecD-like DNA helicase [Actinocorallia sp. A-T 12471]|uniref:ATP-dependent RecD-like DNA helicase n=1 Tax=Actinocorallia sp. A-T 12471 TaxID=3089813 RepID=UPI0029CC3BE8|nr:ATP-dependent RecD-like DNA helicase [Actinocorallia sp. A-T 12471]MDX6744313.1 ATP-dependent RecD-like DNA helicase [Actinocorallia sp. A-T 12471]